MRVLLIGKGGREHALAWKIARSPLLTEQYVWPGNPAMASLTKPLGIPADASFDTLVAAAREHGIDLVVSGPEAPLSLGLADAFATVGIPTFGPVQAAAQLEASKAFAKAMMQKAGIPTAAYVLAHGEHDCQEKALAMLERCGGVVLKASGLAAGKGVFVCKSALAIEEGLSRLFHSDMRQAATTVVLEEILVGRECSYFSFIGAQGPIGLGFAVDFKRLEDGDAGPNTGGMGCYAPVPWLPAGAEERVIREVIDPLLQTLRHEGVRYLGCLYVGLMWSETKGPQVVEFNVRLGDPEAQVLAVYDDRDWLALMAASCGLDVARDTLRAASQPLRHEEAAVAVVMAASSYPYGEDVAGEPDRRPRPELPMGLFASSVSSVGLTAFAAAMQQGGGGGLIPGDGRVLTVAARGANFTQARAVAYQRVDEIASQWPSARWRRDIAQRIAQEVE